MRDHVHDYVIDEHQFAIEWAGKHQNSNRLTYRITDYSPSSIFTASEIWNVCRSEERDVSGLQSMRCREEERLTHLKKDTTLTVAKMESKYKSVSDEDSGLDYANSSAEETMATSP